MKAMTDKNDGKGIPTRIEFEHEWYQTARLLPTHNEKLNFLLDILANEFDQTGDWVQATIRERLIKHAAARIRRYQEKERTKAGTSYPTL